MRAADIMSTDVVTIDRLASIFTAAQLMKQQQVRALIVPPASERDAYGIITATDISRSVADGKNPKVTYVCQVMTEPCIVVNPDLAVEHIAKLFARAKIRIAPVIQGQLLGIISLNDLLTKTDCLSKISADSTPQEKAELTELFGAEISEIDPDKLCENWCSG
ncbi:MAG: CBS domain-containing protein [Prochloraceae cyanobacterium]|nr:CBS domain-containing protein [Prochloraceae cyanobacterium]